MVALNRSTQILIDNFIDKHFQGKDKDKEKVKQEALEIADSILEQSNKDIDKLATKSDILEIKYELLKWLVMTQIAIAGLLVATKLM